MNELDLMAPSKVAEKYGGDKRKIAQAAQMGLIDPTVAVMAGMFIDRMRGAAATEQQPQTTVAQDVMAPSQGLTALPAADQLYDEQSFAGGGIVAFDNGGMAGTFDSFMPQEQYDEFSSYQPMFPSFGEGNRRYALKQLGYTNEEIRRMPVSQQEFIVQNANKQPAQKAAPAAAAVPPAAPPAADIVPPKKDDEPKKPKVDEQKAEKALTDYASKVKDLERKFGVSGEPDAKAREALDKYREKLTKDLDKAGALGLIQAGLGIAGGKSRYALQNLAGAAPAITEYGKAAERIRGEEKGIIDSEAKLDQAADARARGNVKLALELEKQAEEMALRERQVLATEKQAARPSQAAEYIDFFRKNPAEFRKFMEAQRPGFETADIARQRAVAEEFGKLYGTRFMQLSNSKKPEDKAEAMKMLTDFYTARGVTPPMGGAGGGAGGGGGAKFLGFE